MFLSSPKKENLNEKKVFVIVLVFLAIILGSAARINFISGTGYPVNDGGLFYRMTSDLLNNNLSMPATTTYNQDQLPFAYPPVAFYLVAIIHLITKISLLDLYLYVPCTLSILTIPAFYYFAKGILKDQLLAAIALMFFAMVPRAFEWFVMGGGVTRSLGFLFAILALEAIWQLFSGNDSWLVVSKVIVFSAGTVLSHPETGIFVIYCAASFALFNGLNKNRVIKSLVVAAGVLLLASPWIIRIITTHGLDPFLGAGGTGHGIWFEVKNLLTLNFGFENGYFLSVYSIFALVAIIVRRDKLTYFLYGMLFVGYLLFPRSGVNILTIFISILAAIGLSELIMFSTESKKEQPSLIDCLAESNKAKIVLSLTIIYIFVGAFSYKYINEKNIIRIDDEIIEMYDKIEGFSQPEDTIIFYPSNSDNRFWWNDFISEWFPALTERQSSTTVQGYEWVPDLFDKKVENYIQLRACMDIGPVCIKIWEENNADRVDYLIISETSRHADFVNSFLVDSDYNLIHEQADIMVFEKTY